uniref:Putative cytochrome c biosynthesis ccmC-like mitochondrial protein n=1 Tax=Gonatozygon brebissonii TaxID=184482 RepID=A0A6G9IF23_9VIRI|nr:subunit of ABC transporter for cytochrome c1 [Gonatozygon brebissonii]QIQ23060.1 subunit of ABC transporter for cytochrome c1 [Gonatozygon brebissonii]
MYFEVLRPYYFMLASLRLTPFILGMAYFLMAIALYLCIWVAPSDFQQGENYRIIYVHVPAAWMSLFLYIIISITSFIYLITKHPILNFFSQTGALLGLAWTFLTLLTGCFWGKPMWGTFWVWDARLTSVLILFFIYLGALRLFEFSAEIGSIFICIGLINIPIIKFSVKWWNTLHQPSSISQFGTSIHISMLVPLLFMFFSFFLFSLVFVSLDTRKFILSSYTLSLKKLINHTQAQVTSVTSRRA